MNQFQGYLRLMSTIRGVLNRFMTNHINNVAKINRSGYDVEYKCFGGASDDWDGYFFKFNQMADQMIHLGKGWWDIWVTARINKYGYEGQEPTDMCFTYTSFNIYEILYDEMIEDACNIYVMNRTLTDVAERYSSEQTGCFPYWDYKCSFFDDTDYKSKPDELLYEVEYKLSCYYEGGHLDRLALEGEDGKEEQDNARSEVRSLKKWIKKWKPVITWMSTHKLTIEGEK